MGKEIITKVAGSSSSWLVAHEALSRLARERARADAEEGRWLLAAFRAAAHVHLGFGSFGEYIERLFGYQPRSTQEKLRVAEALEGLPALARALSAGELHWSVVRELTRAAVAETEREWLELAHGKTLRQVEALVAGKRPGDAPTAPGDLTAQRHVLRFEVRAETFAAFREARAELRRRTGASIEDEALLLEMARLVLQGPRDDGRASYQISLSVCPDCERGRQAASGDWLPVSPEIVEMARCDGQDLGQVSGESLRSLLERPPAANQAAPSIAGAPVGAGSGDIACATGGDIACAPAGEKSGNATPCAPVGAIRVDMADASVRAKSGSRAMDSAPVGASGGDLVGAPVGAKLSASTGNRAAGRAVQRIPPALRRSVLLRDRRRCRVPGCRNSTFLDVHHLTPRSEGGGNTCDNLVTLCGVHHRAAHRGELSIDGKGATVVFRHADGSGYGQAAQPEAQEVAAKVFAGLRNLGFREGEVSSVLERLRTEGLVAGRSAEQLLREALARLRPSRACVV